MRVLVAPHQMSMGGSQINAIELAAAVRDQGHEVVLYAPNGVLDPLVKQNGLYRVVRPSDSNVSMSSIRALIEVVRRERIDLIHAYEWGPSVEATFGPHLLRGIPVVMTVLSMDVPHFLPRHLPMTVGTEELRDQELANRMRVHLTEPPIDTAANRSVDAAEARSSFGFSDVDVVIATVCRLTSDLDKLAGTLDAIDVVDGLARYFPVKLLIVGDGPGLDDVRNRADEVNYRHGTRVVLVVGSMLDPRIAYDSADIMVGMGSSALKSLAFAKPLVVQGESGFWKLLTPDTVDGFLYRGWFGRGGGGAADLRNALTPLVTGIDRRKVLGQFGFDLATQRFALDVIARDLISIYEQVLSTPPRRNYRELATAAQRTLKFAVHRYLRTRFSAAAL